MNAYLNHYQNNQVQTASREQILLMLYDGAIRFTRQTEAAIGEGAWGERIRYADKAVAILTEFRNTLDHQIGGQIAADLDRLYDFMIREIIRAKVGKDARPLESVLRILCDLRETWAEAIELSRHEASAGEAAAVEVRQVAP